jgi:hypothetical protein
MPFQPPRTLSVLASALTAVGVVLAAAACSNVTPLGPDPAPAGDLGSPITMQVMRAQLPAATGDCPAGSILLLGSEPNVLRIAVHSQSAHVRYVQGSRPTPAPPATPVAGPPASSAGVACYRPVGTPVTITSAAVSSVTTYRHQTGPAWYAFVVTFPPADVPALTALIQQAYASGDAVGMSVAGKLWQAPQPRRRFNALRAEQVNLLSGNQAVQLYRLLVPVG